MMRPGLLTWILLALTVQGCAESPFQAGSSTSARPTPTASAPSTADAVPVFNNTSASPASSPSSDGASSSVTPSPTATATPTPSPTPVVFDPDHIQIETLEAKWKKLSDEEGVQTYQEKNSAQDVVAFRGETVMPTTLARIATVLRDESIRKDWVDSLAETKTLEKVSEFEQIEYNHSKVPWPFQDRDFVYRVKVKVNRDATRSMLITMVSEASPLQPEKSGIVRGAILHSFYYMKEVPGPEPKTQVLIEMALDPKGAIPMWMVNLTQKKWPHNTLLALRKIASKPDLVVPKEIEDYFNTTTVVVPKRGKKK